MTSDDARRRRTTVAVASGTALVAIGLLIGLPALDTVDEVGPVGSYPAPLGGEWIGFALVLLAQAAVLLASGRSSRATPVAVAFLAVAGSAVSPGDFHTLAELAVIVSVALAVVRVRLGVLWPALAATAGLVVVAEVTSGILRADTPFAAALGQGLLQAAGTVGLPLLVALVIRSRRDERSARTAEASAIGREQEARIDAAVSRERTAMARELHDIAAHHLSGIALMAAVIDRQIDSDPERAHEGVRQVREESTAVLDDLRRLVGLLRDDAPAERAVETVAGILDLVERTALRSDVRLAIRTAGDQTHLADGVGPLAQLAAYRTAQEALANAALHAAGAPVTVTIDDLEPSSVTIRIENGPAAAPAASTSSFGGSGVRGMRERADLVGARLQAGPTDDGGWRVELTLTREAPLAADDEGAGVSA
ncbi:histidine kinase [Frondihabitans sp. VKM Ac-2883]|uniref:sensor histidine kinase n=1 Tax=Frondihabitans sp. VKM Ac-2883 TaxID=2783823 RepID=UPI00188B6FC3|nr:sensor histidine kinase [Frondihabitans sp. VKM Ac-2883]